MKSTGQYVYRLAWDSFHGEEFGDELNNTDHKACQFIGLAK